jgi:predicted metal-dependent RNase
MREIVESSDRTIIPSFTVGRAQEVLSRLVMEGVDRSHRVVLPGMAGSIARMVNASGDYVTPDRFNESDFAKGDVVISGGGMLQGGVARSLLDASKDDHRTSVILCGYLAQSTLGY